MPSSFIFFLLSLLLLQSFVSCAHGVQWVGYVMTAYGVLTVAQALGMNTLFARYLGRYVMLAIAGVADTSTAITMLLWNPVGSSVALFFILPCVSGIAEGVMQAQLSCELCRFSATSPQTPFS